MSVLARKEIPLVIAIGSLLLILGEYILAPLETAADQLVNFAVILATFTLVVAAVTLCIRHGRVLYQRGSGYLYSLTVLATFAVMMILGFITGPTQIGRDANFLWIYNIIIRPAGTSVFSLLAFFVIGGAYRAFRARSGETVLLMVVAMLCFWANSPLATMMGPFRQVQAWVLKLSALGPFRAIIFTAAFGTVALGLKTILGRERAWE